MVHIQIPLLFDISAGGITFGKLTSAIDMFDSHLKFEVFGDTGASLVDEFKKILYADAQENITSGPLFYSSGASDLSQTLGDMISNNILGNESKLIQPYSRIVDPNTSEVSDDWTVRYKTPGIPLPNNSTTETFEGRDNGPNPKNNTGYDVTGQGYYRGSLTDPTGTSFGRILIRLMATHLMGHPFAQDFIANETEIMADISNSNIQSQISNKLFTNDPDLYGLRGSGTAGEVDISGANLSIDHPTNSEYDRFDPIEKSNGIINPLLLALYEGLIGTDPARFDLSTNDINLDVSAVDVSGGTDMDGGNLDPTQCRPRRLPFRSGDTISFYFRPRVSLSIDPNISNPQRMYGNNDLSGVGQSSTNGIGTQDIRKIFYQPKYRWISHQSEAKVYHSSSSAENLVTGNGYDTYHGATVDTTPNLMMTGTDLYHTMEDGAEGIGANSSTTFDGHVWRVKLNL